MIWNNIKINVQKRSSSLYTLTAFPGSPLRLQTSVKPFSSNYLVQKFDHNIQRWWSEASRRYRNTSAASGAILFQCNYEKNTDSTINAKHLDSVCSELRDPVKTNRGASWMWKEWTEIMWTMLVIKHITNQEGTKLITENTEHQFDSQNLPRTSDFTQNDHSFSLLSWQLHTFPQFSVAYTVVKTICLDRIILLLIKLCILCIKYYYGRLLKVILHNILHHSNKN